MATNSNTGDFFNGVILATAAAIAREYLAGNTTAASNKLDQHLSALTDADAARFIECVQRFIEGVDFTAKAS